MGSTVNARDVSSLESRRIGKNTQKRYERLGKSMQTPIKHKFGPEKGNGDSIIRESVGQVSKSTIVLIRKHN